MLRTDGHAGLMRATSRPPVAQGPVERTSPELRNWRRRWPRLGTSVLTRLVAVHVSARQHFAM